MNPPPVFLPIAIVLLAILVVALCIRRLRTLQRTPPAKWRRITEWVLLSLVILVCVVGAGSTIYNAAALRYYRAIYPAPGTMYSVNGHDMHLYCTGAGSPTIILESGWGSNSATWAKVQPELSRITRVCSYDRAGFGWSTAQPPPRDADTIARELHVLLQQADVQGPLVLMGHSAGGIYIRDYASHYPANIAGLIFVDSPAPLHEDRESAELRATSNLSRPFYYVVDLALDMGLVRMAGQCAPEPGLDEPTGKRIAQLQCGVLFSTFWNEYRSDRQSGEETIHTGPYGDLPVLIFSHDTELARQTKDLPPKLALEMSVVWDQAQEDLKRLSTRSRRIIAKGSGHHIQYDRSDLLNREVAIFIQQIRDNEPRSDYGSTKTE
ncbi:MAG: alpha/beta fold hydrolase [Candidatus Korobacteraceae bacterium]